MVKIILTGTSGFIGNEVLKQCIANPKLTSIIALTRKPLSSSISSPKLKVLIVKDFLKLDEHLHEFKGAGACVWALGSKDINAELDFFRKVTVQFPMTAAHRFADKLVPQLPVGQPFRFAFLSGYLSERDPKKKTWFANGPLHIKGEAETALLDFAAALEKERKPMEIMVARPRSVFGPESNIAMKILGAIPGTSIRVEVLAKTLLDFSLEGSRKVLWENAELKAGL